MPWENAEIFCDRKKILPYLPGFSTYYNESSENICEPLGPQRPSLKIPYNLYYSK